MNGPEGAASLNFDFNISYTMTRAMTCTYKDLKDKVIDILDNNHAKLSSSIEPCLRMFSDKLFEEDLIDEMTKNELPTDYGKVINAFKASLGWTKYSKLKSILKKFCDILKDLRGAPRLAAENLEKDFNKALTIRCSCGDEALVLTTRMTSRNGNGGRVFYKCPKGVGERKCRFFLWADEFETPSSPSQSFSSPTAPSFSNNSNRTSQSSGRQSGFLSSNKGKGSKGRGSSKRGGDNYSQQCKCNLPVAQRTVKQGSNSGRPFINCPKPRNEQCDFFEWTDNNIYKGGGANQMRKRSRSSMVYGDDDGPAPKKRAVSTCSICRMPGHTKRNCPQCIVIS